MNTVMESVGQPGVVVVERDDEINLLEYWEILRDRRWLVMVIIGAAFLLALVFTLLATPIYRASTTLQIERDSMQITSFEGLTPIESSNGSDFYQTQYELLQSRSLAMRVIQDLRLAEHQQFADIITDVDGYLDSAEGGPPSAIARQEAHQKALVPILIESLTIEPVRNSRLVKVNFDSPDPVLAARVANAYAEAFIASSLERRFDAASYATKYLQERLAQLKARLEDSEKEVVQFSEREQIISIGGEAPSLSAQNLSQLNSALADAQKRRIETEAKWREASAGSGLGLPEVVANQLVQKLREERAKAAAEYREKLGTFKPDFPDMVRLRGQIEELDAQIAGEVANIRHAIRAEYDAALAQENLVREQMAILKGEVLDLQARSIQYNILKREADTNRQIYDALLQRYKEIGVAGGIGANNISVIDRANPPADPHSPRLALNLAVGLLLGAILGALVSFLLHYLDRTIKSPDGLRVVTERPVLGVIPLLDQGITPAQAANDLRSSFSEAYRSVRTALQFATPNGIPRSLLITSAAATEGKTTSALELARNFAQLGLRVALVDADLRNPSIHRVLNLPNAAGLSSLLAGAASKGDAMQILPDQQLTVITAGPLPPSPPELLAGDKLPALLQSLRESFDVVVLDGPPVLGLADALLLAHQAEATLIVAAAEQTRSDSLQIALQRLASVQARILGSLLTRFDIKHKGAGYGYTYYNYGGERQ